MGILNRLFGRQPKPGRPQPTSQATFDQDVLSAPRPVVVDFWARWCAPCQVMSGLLEELGPAYAGQIDFFKLDIGQDTDLAAAYSVRSVPTLMFFHDGAVVNRIVGLMPLHPLQDALNHLVSLSDNNPASPPPPEPPNENPGTH